MEIRSESDRIAMWVFGLFALAGGALAIFDRHPFSIAIGTLGFALASFLTWGQSRCKLVLNDVGVLAVRLNKPAVFMPWGDVDHFAYRGVLSCNVGAWVGPDRWIELQRYGRAYRAAARATVAELEAFRCRGDSGPPESSA